MIHFKATDQLKRMMNRLPISILLSIGTLTLSGCNPDFYVSQTPVMEQFQRKSPEEIYREANDALEKGSYNKAISHFKALIRLYPRHNQIELAQLGLVTGYASRGQVQEALRKIDEFIRVYPNSGNVAALKKKKVELKRKQSVNKLYHQASTEEIKKKNKAVLDKVLAQVEKSTG